MPSSKTPLVQIQTLLVYHHRTGTHRRSVAVLHVGLRLSLDCTPKKQNKVMYTELTSEQKSTNPVTLRTLLPAAVHAPGFQEH